MAETVKVMVRVRPMNQKENNQKCKIIVETNEKINQIVLMKLDEQDNNKNFSFDCIFPMTCTQNYIYQQTAFNLVESVVEGYNGTIFAYGQTGCGKTFTMMGVPDKQQLKGIIPRTFSHIMNIIQSTKQKKFLVRCSFLEIYNEQVHDLLSKDIKEKKQVKQSADKGIYVKDLSMNTVKTVEDMDKYLNLGFKNRAVGATEMNKDSSRSHSIFTIYLETEQAGPIQTRYVAGKLNLVDLAGSQRQSKTKAQGDRLKEATKINLSLSALGNVISALVDGKSKHIPYRDSKLTRLLQDSLGGNTKTIMIANVSPADYNYQQTLSTLRYASRAKFIQNKPTINEDPKDALLKEYAEQIKRLKMMLENGGSLPVNVPQNFNMNTVVGEGGIRTIQVIKTIEVGRQFEEKLKDTEDQLRRQKEQKQGILEKLKSLEQQVVQGGQKQNTVQAKKYNDLKNKVKKQKLQQDRLLQQAAKAEEQLVQVTSSFKNIQQQNAQIKQKLKLLQSKYKQAKKQINDLEHQHAREKAELLDNIRDLERETKFFAGIVKRIIQPDQIQIIRSVSEWNEQIDDFYIAPFLLKQKKVSFPKLGERQVQALIKQDMNNRELIIYEDEATKGRKAAKSNWQQTSKDMQKNSFKTQKKLIIRQRESRQTRESRESRDYLLTQKEDKETLFKPNKNMILAPLTQDIGESGNIQRDTPYKNNKTIETRGDLRLQIRRNKMLQPLLKQ